MDLKLKTFREKLTKENEAIFSSIKDSLDGGNTVMMDVEIVNEKKGEITISGYGFSERMKDKPYVDNLIKYGYQPIAPVFDILKIGEYLYIKLFLPYPWLPDREPIGNPEVGQQVPDLSMPKSEEQQLEVRIVGIKHHATEEDVIELKQMSKDGGKITLMAEPDNDKDPYAVRACLPNGKTIGYVKSESAPFLSQILQSGVELQSEVRYVDYKDEFADITIKLEYNKSIEMVNLFSKHTPQAIYKALFMRRRWLAWWEDEEDKLLDPNEMLLNFDYLLSFPINTQNRLASSFGDLMKKVSVDNPTNPGLMMTVPLDLSVYGTSWEDIDLVKDNHLIDIIDSENKMMAIFLRVQRTSTPITSVQQFSDYIGSTIISETLFYRIDKEIEKNYSFLKH